MKTIKTFSVEFKSGRKEIFFAYNLNSLKTMCTWGNVKKVNKID